MPRAAADQRIAALEARVTELEAVVATLLSALEDELDAEDAPLQDLHGNTVPAPREPGRNETL